MAPSLLAFSAACGRRARKLPVEMRLLAHVTELLAVPCGSVAMTAYAIYCGFTKLQGIHSFFRASNIEKGRKLLESKHVYNVKEVSEPDTTITGKCVAQTSRHSYDISIRVESERTVPSATCGCKGGIGGQCKHAAAVALYVNSDPVQSCTDRPQACGRPSTKPTLDNELMISELFAEPKRAVRLTDTEPCHRSHILDHFPDNESPLVHILKYEQRCSVQRLRGIVG